MNGSQCRPGTAARDGRQIALGGERRLLLVLQRQPQTEAPVTADLHSIGVIARIVDVTPVELPEASGVLRVLVKGSIRARIDALHEADALRADLTVLAETDTTEQPEVEALRTPLLARFEQHTHATRSWPPQEPGPAGENVVSVTAMSGLLRAVIDYLACVDDAGSLADQLAAQTSWLAPPRQQELLEILDAGQRLERLDVLTWGPAPAAPAAAASPA